MKRILDRFLTQRWLPVLLATIAILLILPSVWNGWLLDDISHRYFLLGHPDSQGKTLSAMDMFAFPQAIRHAVEQ